MYTLLSGAYRHYFQKDEYCILILGLDDAGKTTFLEQTKTKFSKGKYIIEYYFLTNDLYLIHLFSRIPRNAFK